jgi:hypothetical protein
MAEEYAAVDRTMSTIVAGPTTASRDALSDLTLTEYLSELTEGPVGRDSAKEMQRVQDETMVGGEKGRLVDRA